MIKRTLHYLGLGLLPALLGSVFVATPKAQAGQTCNYINQNLFMAQAYQNANQVWVSEGWWVIEPGECVVYADNVSTFFKISENVTPPRLQPKDVQLADLCVVNDRFMVYQADNLAACDSQDGDLATFLNPGSGKELLQEP
ncbi:DUF1036 domain-containing protein [Synechocystis sp. LKSZ1]|uniref:DUF1036 domain-containing protein n=1 Tax=Synechocystis sp. LKSZ1 TaxID=3144951 RepID=UPI00336BB5D4